MPSKSRKVRFQTPDVLKTVNFFLELELKNIVLPSSSEGLPDLSVLDQSISILKEKYRNSEIELKDELKEIVDSLLQAIEKQKDDREQESLWKNLLENKIEPLAVSMLLYRLMETEKSYLGIWAASLYGTFLQVPGAFLYHIFDGLVFEAMLSILNVWVYTVGGTI